MLFLLAFQTSPDRHCGAGYLPSLLWHLLFRSQNMPQAFLPQGLCICFSLCPALHLACSSSFRTQLRNHFQGTFPDHFSYGHLWVSIAVSFLWTFILVLSTICSDLIICVYLFIAHFLPLECELCEGKRIGSVLFILVSPKTSTVPGTEWVLHKSLLNKCLNRLIGNT